MGSQPLTTSEQFHYPVGNRVLRGVDEFREMFLPEYFELDAHGLRVRRTLEMLLRHTSPEPLTMLDYGCGAGTFAHQVAKRRPRWAITGWEGDDSAYTVAEEVFALDNLSFAHRSYGAHAE